MISKPNLKSICIESAAALVIFIALYETALMNQILSTRSAELLSMSIIAIIIIQIINNIAIFTIARPIFATIAMLGVNILCNIGSSFAFGWIMAMGFTNTFPGYSTIAGIYWYTAAALITISLAQIVSHLFRPKFRWSIKTRQRYGSCSNRNLLK